MTLHTEPTRVPNISEYPERMRGGTWDRQTYTGDSDGARQQAGELAQTIGATVREHPSWATSRPQIWYDGWRHAWRVLRFRGSCVICNRRTYAFDDGENDPRGILGDHAATPITSEDVPTIPDGKYVPACFSCMNDEPRYRMALERASRAA